ncbi:hypothetical protein E3P94_01561 [Wallemia ichthyophaga]|nr:hypothetical protein E3P98_00531 [Wallemia ichthyophaga]TIB01153.1 hypothetical protein E3P95_01429 [Wallemia ichthyophaga]TIB02123.1 hypothetical protein E3P94_01561 [Wallemia ichthyophaga]
MLSDVVIRWLGDVTTHYREQSRVSRDVCGLLEMNETLSPRTEVYTHDNGRSELLVNVYGTLPIQFRDATYNIPLSLWLPLDYPASPPWVYVVPTATMLVRAGHGVESSGLVRSPYVFDWARKPEACNLVDLAYALRNSFEMFPPLYAKPVAHIGEEEQQQSPKSATSPRSNSHEAPTRPYKPPSFSMSPTITPLSWRNEHGNAAGTSQSQSQSPPQRPPPIGAGGLSSPSRSYDFPAPVPAPTLTPSYAQQQASPQPLAVSGSVTDLLTTEPDSIPYQHIPQSQATQTQSPTQIQSQSRTQMKASSSESITPSSKPTRPLNPNTVKLHATIHAILSQKVAQSLENHKKLYDSQQTLKGDLERAREVIVDESARLESVNEICTSVAAKVNDTVNQGISGLEVGRRRGDIGVDEIVCADNLVSNQLLDLIAEDRAIEDTMYHLGRALNAGKVDLEKVLRAVRELSREQFLKRALCKKIQAGLEGSSDGNALYSCNQTESFHQ